MFALPMADIGVNGSVERTHGANESRLALTSACGEEAGERGDGVAAEPSIDGKARHAAAAHQRIERTLQQTNGDFGYFHNLY